MNRQLNPRPDETSKFPVPIALFGFNRPDLMRQQIELLRSVRPSRLLVVLDGPRPGKPGEERLCEAVFETLEAIDWGCELEVHRSDRNLGCRKRVSSGLDWVFSRVERAVILEDDCSPHPDFFRYAEDLLERYSNDDRVLHISGFTPVAEPLSTDYDFTRFPMIWGWASWRRAWHHYDESLRDWTSFRAQWRLFRALPFLGYLYWNRKFWMIRKGFNTWDYQWTFACLVAGGHCAIPEKNLIANLGFRADATHTVEDAEVPMVSMEPISFPLRHPTVGFNVDLDRTVLISMWAGFRRFYTRLAPGKGF